VTRRKLPKLLRLRKFLFSLRAGGGCPFRQGFDKLNHQLNARIWESVAVNGLCHPAQIQRGRRTHGLERMDGAQVEGGLPYGYDVDRLNPLASGRGRVSVFDRASSLPAQGFGCVAVNGLCHPAQVRRSRRSRGRKRMDGARAEGRFGMGDAKRFVLGGAIGGIISEEVSHDNCNFK